jgi:outer membrane protein
MTLLTSKLWKHAALALALSVTLGLTGVAAANAQEAKIAAVNSDRILRESAPAKAATVKLTAEFAKRDKDLQDQEAHIKSLADALDKPGGSMTDAQRAQIQHDLYTADQKFQKDRKSFADDLNERRNEELAVVLDRANKVIKQIADQDHYDLIVQDGVYFNPRIDITDQVLKALAANPTGAASSTSPASGNRSN